MLELKVGDKVFVVSSGVPSWIATIAAITPSGQMQVIAPNRTPIRFSANGHAGDRWNGYDMAQWTAEKEALIQKTAKRARLIRTFKATDTDTLTSDQLERIMAIIGE